MLGEPTEQTIQFLKEMLKLLKDTTTENNCDLVIEKRKLLFPLMASLATKNNNKLFCNSIHYEWFKKYPINENEVSYPQNSLENWCIDQSKLDKIIALAQEIIESKTDYILTKAETKTVLYDNEVLSIQNKKLNDITPDMDRWIALLVGNILYNNIDNFQFFNSLIKNFQNLFYLIFNWNKTYKTSIPEWGQELFTGIDMKENTDLIFLNNTDFSGINFSYSHLKNIFADNSMFNNTTFYKNSFNNVHMYRCDLYNALISNILSINILSIGSSQIIPYVLIPIQLANIFLEENSTYISFGTNITTITNYDLGVVIDLEISTKFFNTLNGLLIYGLSKNKFTVEEIKSWFAFETEEIKNEFHAKFDLLKSQIGQVATQSLPDI